jgi:hypothetical protein
MIRIKSLSISLITLASSLFTFASYAQCGGCGGSPGMGWYLQANAGTTRISGMSYPTGTSAGGLGWNVDVGYKFMPFFGFEGGYTSYATTNLKSGGVKYAKNQLSAWDLALKGIFPVSGTGLELFAKVGAAQIRSRTTINNTALAATNGVTASKTNKLGAYMAAGAGLYFYQGFGVNAQWARAKGNSNNTGTLDLYSIGIDWMFG